MVLATHAVVGTIVATTFTTNPYIAFFIAFASHFMLDPIPHWDYKLKSIISDPKGGIDHSVTINRLFFFDTLKVLLDALIGTIVSIFLFIFILKSSSWVVVLASIAGGILPDPLQMLYFKTKSKILFPLQKFHKWIHAKNFNIHPIHGVPLQILVVLVFLSISLIIKK